MASVRPKSSVHQNRRMMTDADRMRIFGPSLNNFINPGNQAIPLSTSYLNPDFSSFSDNSQSIVPPPLPPRPDTSRYSRFSNYNSYYSPMSRFSPGLYTPSYGGYRTPYSRYGMPHDSYNSFIQLAEESTRPAFESIESVVDIVGSISMMLESTYHAVYSSYNAILGVVDQFARLRDHLAQVLSFLALLRGLRYICLKILYLLRLRKDNPSVEAAWKTAKSVSENSDIARFHEEGKSPWPFFMFLGLVVGAPWLMFKLLARSAATKPFDVRTWRGKNGYVVCVGSYDFKSTRRGELSFSAGELLYVAPQHLQANVPRGWILACNKKTQVGLVPQNYLVKAKSQPSQRPVAKASPPAFEQEPCSSTANADNSNPFATDEEIAPKDDMLQPLSVEDDPKTEDQKE